jgi:hypothetical protein
MTVAPIHTGLTLDEVDQVYACQGRILHNAILLRAHLNPVIATALEEFEEFDALRPSLHDVATRIMEDATLISATMELASQRRKAGAQ